MREIKFRSWDKNNGRMEFFGLGDTVPYYYEDENSASVKNDVMQFTGLHDKNGKEIYEGDVVIQRNEVEEEIGVIEWTEDRAIFVWRPLTEDRGYVMIKIDEMSREILGNIYENPELLPTPTSKGKIIK